MSKITYHRDNTVTFTSIRDNRPWRTDHPADFELAAMAEADRQRVIKHTNGSGWVEFCPPRDASSEQARRGALALEKLGYRVIVVTSELHAMRQMGILTRRMRSCYDGPCCFGSLPDDEERAALEAMAD